MMLTIMGIIKPTEMDDYTKQKEVPCQCFSDSILFCAVDWELHEVQGV